MLVRRSTGLWSLESSGKRRVATCWGTARTTRSKACVSPLTSTDVAGDGRDFGVQMDGGRCETLRKLLGTAAMPCWGTIIWPWDMALHVKSANAIRSLRDGSSVMPVNKGSEYTLCFSRKVSLLQSERNRWGHTVH